MEGLKKRKEEEKVTSRSTEINSCLKSGNFKLLSVGLYPVFLYTQLFATETKIKSSDEKI